MKYFSYMDIVVDLFCGKNGQVAVKFVFSC